MNKAAGIIKAAIIGLAIVGAAIPAMAADGAAIFKSKCAACHGPEGQGTPMAPALQGNKFVADGDAGQIAEVLKNGRAGEAKKYKQFALPMPKQNFSDEEAAAVIEHIKSLAKK